MCIRDRHEATVVSQFGEVLVLKIAAPEDAKKDAKLKVDAAVKVGLKDAPEENVLATVLSIEAENLVLKLKEKKKSDSKAKKDDGKDADKDEKDVKDKKGSESKEESKDKGDGAEESKPDVVLKPADAVVVKLDVKSDDKADAKKQAAAVEEQVKAFTSNVVLSNWEQLQV